MYISAQLRQYVANRADYRCEYCRVREEDGFLSFEIDHIIAQKHGGGNDPNNLAFACPTCNAYKGSDIGTFLEDYRRVIPLYHPRDQQWFDHFSINNGAIVPLTETAQATVKLLQINQPDRIILRSILSTVGHWP